MKVRTDFVTNSSSSSFIISKDNITLGKLQQLLIEIANKSRRYYYDNNDNYEPVEKYEEIAYNYEITDCSEEDPYEDWNDHCYTNHYHIDNNCTIRYNWNIVKEVMNKYNIPWSYGYCD